jgi:hypothetical protein
MIAIKVQNVKFFFLDTSLSSQEVNPIHNIMTPTDWQDNSAFYHPARCSIMSCKMSSNTYGRMIGRNQHEHITYNT